MNYTDLNINSCYESGVNNIVEEFYEPLLSLSVKYDRIAGFFSSSSLAIASRGLGNFIRNGGKMRLICSPILNEQDVDIIQKLNRNEPDITIKDFNIELEEIEDEFLSNHVKALGWMLSKGLLEMKLVIILDETGKAYTKEKLASNGIFHQKVGIMEDADGNKLSFSGSINESATAWINNDEEFKVFKGWTGATEYFEKDRLRFDDIWNGRRKNIKVFDLPTAVKDKIISYSSDFEIDSISIDRYKQKISSTIIVKEKTSIYPPDSETKPISPNNEDKVLNLKTEISLFPYQHDALIKWEESNFQMLFEMATGTGKTRTAIAGIQKLFYLNSRMVVIISCPQNTLSLQWKSEIEKLNLYADFSKIIDGTNQNWKVDLKNLLLKNKVGFAEHCIIHTTHNTASASDFTKILEENIGKQTKILFIGDEVHWLGAKKLRKALLKEYEYRIGLSATPSRWFDDEGTKLIEDYFGNEHFEFTIKDALTHINPLTGKHFLVNYYYYISHIELTYEEAEIYADITKKIAKLYHTKATSKQSLESYNRLIEERANIIKNAENKFIQFERIIDDLIAKDLLENLIVFVSPQQIETVQRILYQKNIIHHRLTQKEGTRKDKKYGGISEREFIIKHFKDKTYKALVAIKCLDEGIDIPSASRGILMASSTNPREYIQRIGRIIRQDEDKTFAYIYDMCVNTIEQNEEYQDIEKKIRYKEQLRMKEIAENSINSVEALENILQFN